MPPPEVVNFMSRFNIFSQTEAEDSGFFSDTAFIAGDNAKKSTKTVDYEFNQWDTLNRIDLYYNSKFETGEKDAEGLDKMFLNICAFRADVASKQIDLDVKDFSFIPEDSQSAWGAYFANKDFKIWAKENYFGELINDTVERYPKYGTVVLKKVNGKLEKVNLKNIRIKQDADNIQDAEFFIEYHPDMTYAEIMKMDGWDKDGLEIGFGETVNVYERYGNVPLDWYKEYQGKEPEDGDEYKTVDTVAIITIKKGENPSDEASGTILFMEEIDERPYEEEHWSRQDGRWLGIGEIEKQFENQVARNMIANFRRKAMMWSSRKIFQSPDDTLAKSLVRDVKDGDVLEMTPNGGIQPVDMTSRSTGEYDNAEKMWEDNSNQRSFTFEVATGETLPSGTPFRLGVVLSNAVNSYFNLKREKLGLFFKRTMTELVIPDFEKNMSREHVVSLFGDEEGLNHLKDTMTRMAINKKIKDEVFDGGKFPNVELIRRNVEEQIKTRRFEFVSIPKDFYKNIKYKVELVITGESVDIPKKVETLTSLYQSLVQVGDPRANEVLARIMALTGENFDAVAGQPKNQPQGMQQATQSLGQAPQASENTQPANQTL